MNEGGLKGQAGKNGHKNRIIHDNVPNPLDVNVRRRVKGLEMLQMSPPREVRSVKGVKRRVVDYADRIPNFSRAHRGGLWTLTQGSQSIESHESGNGRL